MPIIYRTCFSSVTVDVPSYYYCQTPSHAYFTSRTHCVLLTTLAAVHLQVAWRHLTPQKRKLSIVLISIPYHPKIFLFSTNSTRRSLLMQTSSRRSSPSSGAWSSFHENMLKVSIRAAVSDSRMRPTFHLGNPFLSFASAPLGVDK